MALKNYFYNTGKILYKIAKVPFNILVGNYLPKNQELIKINREFREEIKSLNEISKINKLKLEAKLKDEIELKEVKLKEENPLAYQIYRNIELHRNMGKNYLIN